MKKGLRIISGIAATLILSKSLTNIAFAAGEILNIDDMNVKVNEKYVIGDLDFSGIIDLTDMSIISLYLIGEINLEDIQKVSADINMDGKLDLCDLATFRNYFSKKLSDDSVCAVGVPGIIPEKYIYREPEPSVYPSFDIIPGSECEQPVAPLRE